MLQRHSFKIQFQDSWRSSSSCFSLQFLPWQPHRALPGKAPKAQHTAEPSFSFSDLQSYKLGRAPFNSTGDGQERRTYSAERSRPTLHSQASRTFLSPHLQARLMDEPNPTGAFPSPYLETAACRAALLVPESRLSPQLFYFKRSPPIPAQMLPSMR